MFTARYGLGLYIWFRLKFVLKGLSSTPRGFTRQWVWSSSLTSWSRSVLHQCACQTSVVRYVTAGWAVCPFAVEHHQPHESRAVAGRRQLFFVFRYIFVFSGSAAVLFETWFGHDNYVISSLETCQCLRFGTAKVTSNLKLCKLTCVAAHGTVCQAIGGANFASFRYSHVQNF